MQVAIDGPAGSGKSTVCKIIASKYGFTYIDTGAMYRSIAYVAENFGYDDIEKKAAEVDFILEDNGKKISIRYNGETIDLTTKIRTPEISSKVAFIASNKEIRKILVAKQQSYAKGCDVIMEGRDITTVVLPEADIKVYLTASPEERAKRRYKEWENKSDAPKFEDVLKDIIKRDEMDTNRAESPLMQARDAIFIDTTGLTLEQVSDKIGELIQNKKNK